VEEVVTHPQSEPIRDLSVRARERVLAALRSQRDGSGVLTVRAALPECDRPVSRGVVIAGVALR